MALEQSKEVQDVAELLRWDVLAQLRGCMAAEVRHSVKGDRTAEFLGSHKKMDVTAAIVMGVLDATVLDAKAVVEQPVSWPDKMVRTWLACEMLVADRLRSEM